jgi:hypothetical protein
MNMRRVLDFWVLYWTAMLTVLLAVAHAQQTTVNITLVEDTLGIPPGFFLLLFAVSTVLNAALRVNWKWYFVILSPFILYGVVSIFGFMIAAQSLLTGLLSAHLYGGITITFILLIAVKQDNQKLRNEQKRLIFDIEFYREEIKGLQNGESTG